MCHKLLLLFTLLIVLNVAGQNAYVSKEQKRINKLERDYLKEHSNDSTHVSQFITDKFSIYPYKKGQIVYQEKKIKYIQNEDGKVIINKDYDTINNEKTEKYRLDIRNEENEINSYDENIPPNLESFPDGKYILYYKPRAYYDKDTIKFIRNKIAIIYSIKNNLPEGESYWFSEDEQKIYKKGSYLNGKREGEWTMVSQQINSIYYDLNKLSKNNKPSINTFKSCEYKEGLKNGIETFSYFEGKFKVVEKIAYSNDLKEGVYEYSQNSIPLITGTYKKDERIGDWYCFQRKDNKSKNNTVENRILIEHFKINENNVKGKSLIIGLTDNYGNYDKNKYDYNSRVKFKNENFNEFNKYDFEVRGFIYLKDFIKQNDNQRNDDNYYDRDDQSYDHLIVDDYNDFNDYYFQYFTSENNRLKHLKEIDSLGYIFEYLEYERYYTNGQLFFKFKLNNGVLEKEEPMYWENGILKSEIKYDPLNKQYTQFRYSKKGELAIKTYYDSIGAKIPINKNTTETNWIHVNKTITYKNRIYEECDNEYGESTDEDYIYINKTVIPLIGIDSTYLMSESINKRSHKIYNQVFYNPYYKKSILVSNNLDFKKQTTLTFIFNDEFDKYAWTKKIEFDNLEIISQSIDSVDLNYVDHTYDDYGIPQLNEKEFKDSIYKISDFESKKIIDETPERTILYKGKPFSGEINCEVSNSSKASINKNQLSIHLLSESNYIDLFPSIRYFVETDDIGFYGKRKDRYFYNFSSMLVNFENGKIKENVLIYNKKGNVLAEIPFKNGLIHGLATCYSGYPKAVDYFIDSAHTYFISEKIAYENGQLHGEKYIVNKLNDTLFKCQYLHNNYEGSIYMRDKLRFLYLENDKSTQPINIKTYDMYGKISFETNYLYNTFHGEKSIYYPNGSLKLTANFNFSQLDDSIIQYNLDRTIKQILIYKKNVFIKEMNFKNGGLHDEFIHDTTKYKMTLPYELNFLFDNNASCLISRNPYHNDIYYTDKEGYQIFYNEDGSKRGKSLKNVKYGTWNYVCPKPLGTFTIEYKDSSVQLNDTLNFITKGKYIHKDSKGNILSNRYLLSEEMVYNCGQGETYEIVSYYIESENDSSNHLRNGFMKNYYASGVKQSEGFNKNGLPTGSWKFYNDNGSLRETGHYVNGKKQGRWLSGDLSKINYLGDMCFDLDNEKMQELVNKLESQLEITETYYDKGEVVKQDVFYLQK